MSLSLSQRGFEVQVFFHSNYTTIDKNSVWVGEIAEQIEIWGRLSGSIEQEVKSINNTGGCGCSDSLLIW